MFSSLCISSILSTSLYVRYSCIIYYTSVIKGTFISSVINSALRSYCIASISTFLGDSGAPNTEGLVKACLEISPFSCWYEVRWRIIWGCCQWRSGACGDFISRFLTSRLLSKNRMAFWLSMFNRCSSLPKLDKMVVLGVWWSKPVKIKWTLLLPRRYVMNWYLSWSSLS